MFLFQVTTKSLNGECLRLFKLKEIKERLRSPIISEQEG